MNCPMCNGEVLSWAHFDGKAITMYHRCPTCSATEPDLSHLDAPGPGGWQRTDTPYVLQSAIEDLLSQCLAAGCARKPIFEALFNAYMILTDGINRGDPRPQLLSLVAVVSTNLNTILSSILADGRGV